MTSLSGILPRARDIRRAAAAAPKSNKDVEGWRKLLDEQQTDERMFLGCFKIQSDIPEDAPEDADPWVDFVFRAWQEKLYERLFHIRTQLRRHAKIRMPKARGTGASSFSIALYGFCRILRRPGFRCLVIAQDQDESEEHLSRLTDFYEQAFDERGTAALAALGITLEKSNRRSITIKFVDPKTKRFLGRSRVRVKTARAKGLGRGGGYDAIITTERPHWPDKCKRDLKGFLARMTRSRWSAHIDESSPNGIDDFFKDCQDAEKGRGGYEVFFIPAYARPENYIAFRSPEERATLESSLGKTQEHGGDDELESYHRCVGYWQQEGLELTDAEAKALEWAKFRREAIEGECRGSVENFHQEHGTTISESFQGSGRPALELSVVRSWVEQAYAERATWTRYSLEQREGGTVIAVPNRNGLWSIREMPRADGYYCHGEDCAGGEETDSEGKETDFSYASIGDVYTGDTIAELEAHIEPHLYADEIAKASQFWRCPDSVARGLVEANNDMGGATINTLMLTEFDWGDGVECLLETTRQVKTDTGFEKRTQLGFKTGPKSKETLISALRRFLTEVGPRRKDETRRCPWSFRVVQQMTRYVYKGKKMQAESGHDDGVISEALKQLARRMLLDGGEVPIAAKVTRAPIMDPIDEFWRGVAESRKKKLREGSVPCLGSAY